MSPELERALEKIPSHMKESIIRYLEHGIEPGSFLQAVLENNLMGAGLAADSDNIKLWLEYCDILYYMPRDSVGSAKIVAEWMRNKQNQK